MSIVRNLMVRAGADFSSLRREMQKAQKNVQEFKSGIEGALGKIGLALGGLEIGEQIADATRSAMQVEAAMMQINRTMGSSAGQFRDWANTTASSFNMSKGAAIQYGAIYSNLISSFSGGADKTEKMTEDLLKASAVVASGTGRTMEDVMWRIRSGLLGNTEAVEDLGIQVYVNMLKSTDAFRTFAGDKSWDQLDFNTQSLIRYYGIMEQAQKKFGLEINVNTNSALQALQAALGNVKLALGEAFLPIVNIILPLLTSLAQYTYMVVNAIGMFVRALLGYKDPSTQMKNQATQAQNLAAAYKDAGDAAQQAGDDAKEGGDKAKSGVAGFDEVNQLSNNSDSSSKKKGGAGGAAGNPLNALPEVGNASFLEPVTQGVQDFVDKIKKLFGDLKGFVTEHKDIIIAALGGIAAGFAAFLLITNWETIIAGIARAVALLAGSIEVLWAAILGPEVLIAAAIAALVAAFIYFYETNEGFRGTVDSILQSIGEAAKWLWNEVLVPFGKWLGDAFVTCWKAVGTAASWLWDNVLKPLGGYLKSLWTDDFAPIARGLKEDLGVAFEGVAKIAESFWKNVMVPLGSFLADVFVVAVKAVWDIIKSLWNDVLEPFAKFVGEVLKVALDLLKDGFVDVNNSGAKPLMEFIRDVLVVVADAAFKDMGKAITTLRDVLTGLIQFVNGVFTDDWDKAWKGVAKVFDAIFGGIWTGAKSVLNEMIDGLNQLISGFDNISITVPEWVPGFGGSSWHPSIPRIPRLARGGIVDGATNMGNYVAGEAGAEMIVPLENTSFTDKIASSLGTAVMRAMQMGNSGKNGGDVTLQIDGITLARLLSPYLVKEGLRLGDKAIVVT